MSTSMEPDVAQVQRVASPSGSPSSPSSSSLSSSPRNDAATMMTIRAKRTNDNSPSAVGSLASSFSKSLNVRRAASSSYRPSPASGSSASLSPLEAAAKRASESALSLHDQLSDEHDDADDVEARLRFPTFARRPSLNVQPPPPLRQASLQPQQPAQQRSRRASPLRNEAFVELQAKRPSEFSHNVETSHDELFHIDDEEDGHVDQAGLPRGRLNRQLPYSAPGVGEVEEEEEDEEDEEGENASGLFSHAPSVTSQSTRRTSDHSSTDLDMIWDDEDEEYSWDVSQDSTHEFSDTFLSNKAKKQHDVQTATPSPDIGTSPASPAQPILLRSSSLRIQPSKGASNPSTATSKASSPISAMPTLQFARKASESAGVPSSYSPSSHKLSFVGLPSPSSPTSFSAHQRRRSTIAGRAGAEEPQRLGTIIKPESFSTPHRSPISVKVQEASLAEADVFSASPSRLSAYRNRKRSETDPVCLSANANLLNVGGAKNDDALGSSLNAA